MKLHKLISLCMAILVVLTMVTACGGNAPAADAEKEPATENTESSTSDTAETKIKVGFSQTGNAHPWRIMQTNDLQASAEARGYEFVWTDAQEDTAKQIQNVEELINQGIDYLVFDPREYDASYAAVEKAREAGVPVIVVDREVKGEVGTDFITTIASDFEKEGRMAAEWLQNNVEGEIKIVEISHIIGSSAEIGRSAGFHEVVDADPNMTIVASQTGNAVRAEAQKVMENLLQSHMGEFNVVFTHADDMAIGIVQAIKGAGLVPGEDIIVVAVDGMKEAVQMVVDGEIDCIVTCSPYYGEIVFDTLDKIVAGEQVPEKIVVEDYIIDKTNADEELLKAY